MVPSVRNRRSCVEIVRRRRFGGREGRVRGRLVLCFSGSGNEGKKSFSTRRKVKGSDLKRALPTYPHSHRFVTRVWSVRYAIVGGWKVKHE
jgi:hypothetical protein